MTWLRRQQLRKYWRDTVWIMPVLSIPLALIVVRTLFGLELALGWTKGPSTSTAHVVLGTMASSMFTFIVFVSSALLLSVQLASAQLTPRIITFLFANTILKLALTLFVFTFTFTLAVLARVTDSVPSLTTSIAAYGCLANLAVFLYLIYHVGLSLRAKWGTACDRKGRPAGNRDGVSPR